VIGVAGGELAEVFAGEEGFEVFDEGS